MRLLAYLLILLLVSTSSASVRAADSATEQTLLGYEQKYFGRGFNANPMEQRLSRLEKLVLGTVGEGPAEERINQLSASISTESDDSPAPAENVPGTQSADSQTAEAGSQTDPEEQAGSAGGGPGDDTVPGTDDPYPRIGALEASLLYEIYPQDELNSRLTRMEQKVFGHTSDKLELSARTDALEQYAEKKTGKRLFTPTADQQDAVNDDGRTQMAQGQGSALPKIVNMLSTAFLGGAPGFAGAMANAGMAMAGPAVGGVGMGPVRVRQRETAQAEQEPKQPVARPEDPAIFELAPPASDAKLLIKVGWCEVRMFGQTAAALHLPERLEKINTELNFQPGKPGIWLMDHVDALVEAVHSRSTTSIGMTPTTEKKPDDDYNEADTLQ